MLESFYRSKTKAAKGPRPHPLAARQNPFDAVHRQAVKRRVTRAPAA